jgi:hypothetical protein
MKLDVTRVGDWDKAAKILGVAPVRLRMAIDKAVLQEAHFARKMIVEGFRTQEPGGKRFKPLAPTTLAMRRFKGFAGTKALTVRGDLKNSIHVQSSNGVFGVEAFVGVNRTARGREGQPLVNIAEIHEYGSRPILIPVTPAMRRFFFAAMRKGGLPPGEGGGGFRRGFLIVKIPARPYFAPVFAKYFKPADALVRMHARVATNLVGQLGVGRIKI